MGIMTIKGVIYKPDLGLVSPHEHVLIDISNQFVEPIDQQGKAICYKKVKAEHSKLLNENPYLIKDNLLLDNIEIAINELLYFKSAGGDTVVDATPMNIGRNVDALKIIAASTGLNFVVGCGYYTDDTHSNEMDSKTIGAIENELVHDLTIGIGNSGVKAGLIGEIGTGKEFTRNEEKVLRASGRAHKVTGAPVMVHIFPWSKNGIDAVKLLEMEGVKANRICICHSDVMLDEDYIVELLRMGVYVEFDNFGKEFTAKVPYGRFATDSERIDMIIRLINAGFENQLLFSCDICLKNLLRTYGGHGYDHVLTNIKPMLMKAEVYRKSIETILLNNPLDYLDNSKL